MKEVIVVIKYRITDENYQSDEFQEFIQHIQKGELKKDMEEGDFFDAIKITYQVRDL